MLNFKEFLQKLEEQNTVGKHNDGPGVAYLHAPWTGSLTGQLPASLTTSAQDVKLPDNPGLDAILPSVTKTSQIRILERNKNPIFMMLADGTKLYMTWDEFRRIKGPEPAVGKHVTVNFQRLDYDRSSTPSKINSIHCH
jgi:hypothetical protein